MPQHSHRLARNWPANADGLHLLVRKVRPESRRGGKHLKHLAIRARGLGCQYFTSLFPNFVLPTEGSNINTMDGRKDHTAPPSPPAQGSGEVADSPLPAFYTSPDSRPQRQRP